MPKEIKNFILGSFTITIVLFVFFINSSQATLVFSHKCDDEDRMKYYAKVHIPIRFMPGQEKCLEDESGSYTVGYYRNLKEFIITKNNKYCLWGSKNWDEKCQDAAMAYAYGDYYDDEPEAVQRYKKFKEVLINFIRHIQANDIEKALTLTHKEAVFFTNDDVNCLEKEKNAFPGHCRAYFKRNNEYKKHWGQNWGEINLELFRENLMQIDVDNIRFYLADLSKRYIYSVVMPYEYEGTTKYFDIRFHFAIGGGGPAYPYDNYCYPKIYDLGINSKLPKEH